MADLKDVLSYVVSHYPFHAELSADLVSFIIYLADWKKAIDYSRRLTDVQWVFDYEGPYSSDPIRLARQDPNFRVMSGPLFPTERNEYIWPTGPMRYASLTEEDQRVLDFVIAKAEAMDWRDLNALVMATYPYAGMRRPGEPLDLLALARDYNDYRQQFA